MKMIYNGAPVKSLNIHHFEMNTNDCDMVASDLQAGKTAVARGKKITGTGKCFEFASYGGIKTNASIFSPVIINVIEIASLDYPIRISTELNDMRNLDFSIAQIIGYVTVDNVEYPITAQINGVILTLSCEKTVTLQSFYGKDNYV